MPSALRRQIGQLVIAGFTGTTVPVELKSIAQEFGLGGVILFDRNLTEPEQVAHLAFEAARLTPDLPPWISVDQEGGRVARLKTPFTEWPPMSTLGRSADVGLAERFARALAAELKAVGISLDFAPVLDVHTNPKNAVIGDRALSSRADEVATFGAAIVRGLQHGGVAACGKHFPGHGDTDADSHRELPLVEHPVERLRDTEFKPFRAAIEAQVAAIMTAHVLMPAIDEDRPATLSRRVVAGLLREELQFDGMIISDDLEMKAIADTYQVPAAAVMAVGAGCDALLICSGDYEVVASALEALIHAVEEERLSLTRVQDALKRQQRAKERFLAAALGARPMEGRRLREVVGREEHRAIADEMARFL